LAPFVVMQDDRHGNGKRDEGLSHADFVSEDDAGLGLQSAKDLDCRVGLPQVRIPVEVGH
jgi:hypothetical protein